MTRKMYKILFNKKADNENTNELTLVSANVTSWKKNFNEIARLNPDIMALQETKVTKAAKPAANRAAGSEKLCVIWGTPCDQLKKKERRKTRCRDPLDGSSGRRCSSGQKRAVHLGRRNGRNIIV